MATENAGSTIALVSAAIYMTFRSIHTLVKRIHKVKLGDFEMEFDSTESTDKDKNEDEGEAVRSQSPVTACAR